MSRKRNEVCVAMSMEELDRAISALREDYVEGYIHWRKDDEYLCYSNIGRLDGPRG